MKTAVGTDIMSIISSSFERFRRTLAKGTVERIRIHLELSS
jgi:hypothetical protein